MTEFQNEDILPDDYPIYAGYAYVADGLLHISMLHGVTARELKARKGIKELRRCSYERMKAHSPQDTVTPHD